MADARRSAAPHHVVPWQSGRVIRWIASTDHKQVGILMVVTALGFLLLTTALSLVVRSQLVVSEHTAVSRKLFVGLATMNGTTLLFLVVLPLLLGLATYLVPLLIGARDMALPRVTALTYWLYLFAAVFLTATWVSNDGPPRATFESLVPLANGEFSPEKPQTILGISMILLAVSWLLWSLNLLATVVTRRAEGMTWCRLPLFAWAATISAGVLVVATPVLGVATAFLVLDREAGTGILDGDGARSYEHLFWFFGQPAIGVMVILAAGVVSEILPVFARRAIASRMSLVVAFAGIALSSLLGYGRHLATADLATWAQSLFMIASLATVAFAGVAIAVWIATLWSGRLRASAAVMFSVGSIVLLTVGLLASVFLAAFPLSWQLTGTTYEAAQLHYVVEGGVLFAAFAGLFYWWPKMFGRVLDERLGKAAYVLLFIGFNTLYIPQFMLGILGMPADAFTYSNGDWNGYQQHSLVGAAILAVGIALLAVNLVRTSLTGTRVGRDPWSGDTLEWYAASPPVPHNFDSLPAIDSERPVRDARRRLEAAGDR